MHASFIALAIALCSQLAAGEYEVPTKKANPPKMDPIPMLPVITERVYMDIEMNGKSLGRLVFGLYGGIAPKAVENFAALCKCDHGKSKIYKDKDMCYKDSAIHRVIPNFGIQGGDFIHNDGTGSETIFGKPFEDESFDVRHNRKYMLNAVNAGKKNTNGSQWFINTVKTQWLDGKNVIFGMVLEGLDVITKLQEVGTHIGTPSAEIVVVGSGPLPLEAGDEKPRFVSEKLEK